MANLYRGRVVNTKDLNRRIYYLDIVEEKAGAFAKDMKYLLDRVINKDVGEDLKEVIDSRLLSIINPTPEFERGIDILYEKFYDNEGNTYGREILSKLIFPIEEKYTSYDIGCSKGKFQEIYYDKLGDKVYSVMDKTTESFCLIEDSIKKEEFMTLLISENTDDLMANKEKEFTIYGRKYKLTCLLPARYQLDVQPKMDVKRDPYVNFAITNESVAYNFEKDYYYDLFEKGMGRKKRKKEFLNSMHYMFLCNKRDSVRFLKKEEDNSKTLTKKA